MNLDGASYEDDEDCMCDDGDYWCYHCGKVTPIRINDAEAL